MYLFDGHCDTISKCFLEGGGLRRREGHLDLTRTAAFERYAQFFALFADQEHLAVVPTYEDVYKALYALFCREMRACRDTMVFCRTGKQAQQAFAQGKAAAFLSVEGAELLGCDLVQLERAYCQGVRAVNITWNRANCLSGSNCDEPGRGLSRQGKAFVCRMQELGMLVDVSHLSDPGIEDVLELATKPVIASHSNARAVYFCQRNLTDHQFTGIMETGGVVGLCMYADFLGDHAGLDDVVAHLEHFLSLGGQRHVAIGGDWDGCARLPLGMAGIQDMERLYNRLLQRNYSQELIDAIFYSNLMRVVNEVCTM